MNRQPDASDLLPRVPDRIEPDPVIEYYKQFVDREALRENLGRIRRDRQQTERAHEPPGPAYGLVPPIPETIEPDPVIEAYKKDVDRTLLRENLKLTVEQRFRKMMEFGRFIEEFRGSARRQARNESEVRRDSGAAETRRD